MKVFHNTTKQEQIITKADWAVLKKTGHAENFTVVEEEDYTPPELELPTGKKGKNADTSPSPGESSGK